jgi:hypothetical protein
MPYNIQRYENKNEVEIKAEDVVYCHNYYGIDLLKVEPVEVRLMIADFIQRGASAMIMSVLAREQKNQ